MVWMQMTIVLCYLPNYVNFATLLLTKKGFSKTRTSTKRGKFGDEANIYTFVIPNSGSTLRKHPSDTMAFSPVTIWPATLLWSSSRFLLCDFALFISPSWCLSWRNENFCFSGTFLFLLSGMKGSLTTSLLIKLIIVLKEFEAAVFKTIITPEPQS